MEGTSPLLFCTSITSDLSGNIYATGNFNGTTDLDPSPTVSNLVSFGNQDIFVLKLDMNGDFIWAQKMGGSASESGESLKIDASGAVYVTGYFSGMTDFDPGVSTSNLISAGNDDIFLLKLNSNGSLAWVKQIGGTSFDSGKSIALDITGNVYLTGSFIGSVDFNHGSAVKIFTSLGSTDIFVSKFDSEGNFIWAKQMGGNSDDEGFYLCVDGSGSTYVTGSFFTTCNLDPGVSNSNVTSNGQVDIFISKFDQSGNFVWGKAFGGIRVDVGKAIATDGMGNVLVTGRFGGTVNFDPGTGVTNLISAGGSDVFVQKLSDPNLLGIMNYKSENVIFMFPNPANDKITILLENNSRPVSLKTMNMEGKVIIEKTNLIERSIVLDISEQATGIYFVEILKNGEIIKTKFIKN